MQEKKKWAFQLLFLLLVMTATLYGLFRGNDLKQITVMIQTATWTWWLLGLVLVVLFICGESVILHDIMRTLGTTHRVGHCFLYSFIGFFFSCITPSAGGGQPAQVYFMKKDRIPAAVSIPVLILVTITYKLVLVVYGVIVLVFRPGKILEALEPVIGWCYLGFFLNTAFVGLCLMLIFWPSAVERFLRGCLRLAGRFLPQERTKHIGETITEWMERYRDVAGCFQSHWGLLVRVMILTIIQRSLLFAVTWVTMRSFGIHGNGLWTVIVLQAMISMGTDLLPLPGGMGASETMFMRIFPALCGGELGLPVLLVSRGISYYGQLLISAVCTAVAAFVIGRPKGEEREYDWIL